MTVPRWLVRVPLSLEQALSGRVPQLPSLPPGADGYVVTSLPANQMPALVAAAEGKLVFVRQRYSRYFADLSAGFDAWFAQLSGNARSQLKRKRKKLAAASGGALHIERFRTPDELERFHGVARGISRRTYQERLLDAGLPEDAEFLHDMARMGAADEVRAWLLHIGDMPAAYLYCPVHGRDVIYEYVGHDPACNALSPGAVLQLEAIRDLCAEGRFARFDFTEGEGQHKRQMASGGVDCVDLLLLRPSLTNRVALAALGAFDAGVAGAKALVERLGLQKAVARIRRG
ncbi:GNAT family N-acetyltransferase [Sphingomonadaceae bacterium LXI357]|uniref:GNAT family N-acetyltransferase n=2 Tax=Stakelama marina TaxID=2826939 RepID=A0A8T4IF87_9SPHN|nr:GNAT family N-acetyltransferase [Stakelama marina]